MKIERIASMLKVKADDVRDALHYLRENTNPHPGSAFRDPWDNLAPARTAGTRPDVVVFPTASGLAAEIADPTTGRVMVEEVYAGLYQDLSDKRAKFKESDRVHIRDCVLKARVVIEAIEFRKSTLQKIMEELLTYQAGFFLEGPTALKPLTRKDLAARIGVHESTVCRATQDKNLRLPSGEVVSFDVLFDTALPVKEMVRVLSVDKLSDSEIAKKLEELGFPIARRTVAKYREQMRVLPAEYRLS
jgi:RNA polymerase sigma-54 factor